VRLKLIREEGDTSGEVERLHLTTLARDEGDVEVVGALAEAGVPLKLPRL